jgi:hypothetical protein
LLAALLATLMTALLTTLARILLVLLAAALLVLLTALLLVLVVGIVRHGFYSLECAPHGKATRGFRLRSRNFHGFCITQRGAKLENTMRGFVVRLRFKLGSAAG